MIDITRQINAVERTVSARTLDKGEGRALTVSQIYAADLDDLWDACTSPERLPRWFLPVSGELRLGGRYQLEGNAGGTIERCDPPRGFSATWEYDGSVSWIEVRLTAASEGSTRFELEHVFYIGNDHWDEFGPGAAGIGWDMSFLGLFLYLTSGGTADPKEVQAWFATDDGRQFLTSSGDAWRAADVAGGADADVARGMADRASAAYTAVPEQA
jgi:uncharacterized protein YndB with AHSA1/START domain